MDEAIYRQLLLYTNTPCSVTSTVSNTCTSTCSHKAWNTFLSRWCFSVSDMTATNCATKLNIISMPSILVWTVPHSRKHCSESSMRLSISTAAWENTLLNTYCVCVAQLKTVSKWACVLAPSQVWHSRPTSWTRWVGGGVSVLLVNCSSNVEALVLHLYILEKRNNIFLTAYLIQYDHSVWP